MTTRLQRVTIVTSALLLRLLVGALFFGSVDLTTVIFNLNLEIFRGNTTGYFLPYFPIMPALFWLGAIVTIITPLPLALGYKLVPIIADSLIALLIFEILQKRTSSFAFTGGLLYALSPVCLLVTCIHFQWDALFLFFLILAFYVRDYHIPSKKSHYFSGICFAGSILLKPIALIFLPLIITPRTGLLKEIQEWKPLIIGVLFVQLCILLSAYLTFKITTLSIVELVNHTQFIILGGLCLALLIGIFWYKTYKPQIHAQSDFWTYVSLQSSTIIGFCSTIMLSFTIFIWFGFNLIERIEWILRYMNQGVQVFGLPFAYPFNTGIPKLILKNRFWLLAMIGTITAFYHSHKITVFQALLLSFSCIIGFSGLGCQYLLWILPFLIICQFNILSSAYNSAAGIFLTLYCTHPFSNPIPYQNTGSFVPLSCCNWLTPPLFFTQEAFLDIIHLFGNYIIPLCSISILGYGMYHLLQANLSDSPNKKTPFVICNGYTATVMTIIGAITGLYAWFYNMPLLEQFKNTVARKLLWYTFQDIAGRIAPLYEAFTWINSTTLFLLGIGLWSLWAILAES